MPNTRKEKTGTMERTPGLHSENVGSNLGSALVGL